MKSFAFLIGFLVCLVSALKAEVYISGETKSGKKIQVYMDYNTYGAGDIHVGTSLTVTHPNGKVDKIVFGDPSDAGKL